MNHLLDVNVLIALLDTLHRFHDTAWTWFNDHRAEGWSTCPITQNGVIRILSNPHYANSGASTEEIVSLLADFTTVSDHRFLPRKQQKQHHEDHRARLKTDAHEHRFVLALGRTADAAIGRFQIGFGRLQKRDNPFVEGKKSSAHGKNDVDDVKRGHSYYLGAVKRKANGQATGAQIICERCAVHPRRAHLGKAGGSGALGKTLAVGAADQRVVVVARGRQPKQPLQDAVDVGRAFKITTADDIGDRFGGIIDGNSEVIAGERILTRNNDIAPVAGRIVRIRRLCHVEPPCRWPRDVAPLARAGINRRQIALRRACARGNFGAGADAGVSKAQVAQMLECGFIPCAMRRLHADRIPRQSEPAQIVKDARDKFGPTPSAIDIFDPDEKPAPASACQIMCHDRRIGVAEMQQTGWRRCKS